MPIEHGWLSGAARVLSPHCDDRPDPEDISLVVIHGISLPPGEFGGPWVARLFAGTLPPDAHPHFATLGSPRVSAHLFIDRIGRVTQFVPFPRRAWHAGVSCFAGREKCNDYSIGIELEGTDTTPYEEAQYLRLTEVLTGLISAYPAITRRRIVGHADIAPGRKTDPGPVFDWRRVSGSLLARKNNGGVLGNLETGRNG